MDGFMSALEYVLEIVITLSIHALECMGMAIILVGAIRAMYGLARHKPGVRLRLAESMALALEFKLGGEILRTVQVRAFSEIAIVGAIILLRGVLNLLIHHEIKIEEQRDGRAQVGAEAAQAAPGPVQCIFPTPDPERTAQWYCRCLGFARARVQGGIELTGEGARILLIPTQGQRVRPNRELYGAGCDALICVRDVDMARRAALERGATVPRMLNGGGFIAEDVDGRWLRFERTQE